MSENRHHANGADPVHRRRWLWLLLPLVLVFASITSFIAGMNINRITEYPMGKIVDTIILSPKEEVQTITLSGQMHYADERPYANQLVELHSDPMRAETDQDGRFTFFDVSVGTHTFYLLDREGTVISSRTFYIGKSPDMGTGTLEQSGDSYDIKLAIDIVAISIDMELNEDNSITIHTDILSLMPDGTVLRDDGTVVGKAIDFQAGLIDEGIVAEPSASEELASEGIFGTEAATAQADDRLKSPTETGAPGVTEPAETTVPQTMESNPTESSTAESLDTDDDEDDDSEPTNAALDVRVSDAKNEQWTQNTTIDLFADRTGVGVERKLVPGSYGTYQFKVVNYNAYPVSYTLRMLPGKGQFLLPLRYRLKSGDLYLCGDEHTGLTSDQLYQNVIALQPESSNEYILEWEWLYQGGDDELDTKIASAANLEYQIVVSIQITQM